MTKRTWLYTGGGLAAAFVILQLVPAEAATNPPLEEEVTAPPEVMAVLRASCYDCHSHETVWPWYSHVAPAKWLVRGHVAEGRSDLNFSTWNRYDAEERAHKWEEVAEEVQEGHMPLPGYLRLHPEAALAEAARATLVTYADAMARSEGDEQGAGDHAAPPEDRDG